MSKYTPGPYEKVESDIIGEYLIYPPMITSSTGHIAEVHGDNADANANLFVVAPETAAERDRLRGALKDARAKLVFPFVAHDAEDAVRIIDAALAEPESGEKENESRSPDTHS